MILESKVTYGQEHGQNLIRIAKRLLQNQDLLKLLVNTDLDPLNPKKHPEKIDGLKLLNKNIKVVPLLDAESLTTESKIVIFYEEGRVNGVNSDNENMSLIISVYCPFEEWQITGNNLRPFAIMSEIRKSLQDRRINGLGEIRYGGFSLSTLTDEMGCHAMSFYINAFS